MEPSATVTSAKFGIALYPCLTLLIYRELRRIYTDEDLTDGTLAKLYESPLGHYGSYTSLPIECYYL